MHLNRHGAQMSELNEVTVQKLKELVASHGEATWLDPLTSEGLLRDALPGFERERHALCLGARVGFPAAFLEARNPTEEMFAIIRAQSALSNEHLVSDDDARWITDTWRTGVAVYTSTAAPQRSRGQPVILGDTLDADSMPLEKPLEPKGHLFTPTPVEGRRTPQLVAPVATVLVVALALGGLLLLRHLTFGP